MGGIDKAWIDVEGESMLAGCLAQFPQSFAARLVSARAVDVRHDDLGVRAVLDLRAGFPGPVAGLEALANDCTSEWLLTVPVDARGIPTNLIDTLAAATSGDGACVCDADGLQPLLALWRADRLAAEATAALDADDAAARNLVRRLGLVRVDLSPHRLRNLNTPASLQETSR